MAITWSESVEGLNEFWVFKLQYVLALPTAEGDEYYLYKRAGEHRWEQSMELIGQKKAGKRE